MNCAADFIIYSGLIAGVGLAIWVVFHVGYIFGRDSVPARDTSK